MNYWIQRVNDLDCIFITNDDGVSEGLESLITYLHNLKIPLLVIVPSDNKSASSMAITLRKKMRLSRKTLLEKKLNEGKASLSIFTLNGTPTDCALFVDFAKGTELLNGLNPVFAISGINHGANLSHDILHSGTVGAARQTSMNGIPSLASSFCDYQGADIREAAKLTAGICKNIWDKIEYSDHLGPSFSEGKLFINLNVPKKWNGGVRYSFLGVRDYENALVVESIDSLLESDISFDGPNIVEEEIEGTDVTNINSGFASLSIIPTWPYSHSRYPSKDIIQKLESMTSINQISWIEY